MDTCTGFNLLCLVLGAIPNSLHAAGRGPPTLALAGADQSIQHRLQRRRELLRRQPVGDYSDKGFWSDVLNAPYFGFADAYTILNGSFGMKWDGGSITTLVKGTNLLNKDIQPHIFGDIIKRSILAEIRFAY